MKHNMKYGVLPRLLALLFAVTLLLTAAITPAAASGKTYTEWFYDDAAETLTAIFPDGEEAVYLRYEGDPCLRYVPDFRFKYHDTVTVGGTEYAVYAAGEGCESLALESEDGEVLFFLTKDRRADMEAMSKGNEVLRPHLIYQQGEDTLRYSMSRTFLRELNNLMKDPLTETVTDTLYGLRYAPRYELWLYDEDTFLAVNGGFLLDLAGEMYYLNIRELPASALDGEGKLIPSESVTVTLYRLPEMQEEEAREAVSYAYGNGNWIDTEYEAGFMDDITDEDMPPFAFVYLTIALLGIALPIAPLVLGLCLPHSKKQGYKKRWYLLTVLGGAWMLLGILVLVMMIVVL